MPTMSKTLSFITLAFTLSLSPIASAELVTYNANYTFQEVNSSKGTATARPMIAAIQMASIGLSNTAYVPTDEATLLDICKKKTPDNTTWWEECNPAGLATAATDHFSFQQWVVSSAPATVTGQLSSINKALIGLVYRGSPAVMPLYGRSDHWLTIRTMQADLVSNPPILAKVYFYDSGPSPEEDLDQNIYEDGLKLFSGAVFKTTFFKLLDDDTLEGDSLWDRYVVFTGYESGTPLVQAPNQTLKAIEFGGSEPMLGSELLDAEFIASIAFDVLDMEGISTDPAFAPLTENALAEPQNTFEIYTPEEIGPFYFLTLLTDSNDGRPMGTVGIGASGEFLFAHVFPRRDSHPCDLEVMSPELAAERSKTGLAEGEYPQGQSDTVVWRANHTGAGPNAPWYELKIEDGRTGRARTVRVPLLSSECSSTPTHRAGE